jgi:NAD(P)H-nitrite reductase large subunit
MATHVVIGGSIAATQAARTLRSLRAEDTITLVAEEPRPFYTRPLLADYVAGRVTEDGLWTGFESTAQAEGITTMLGHAVVRLDRAAQRVELDDGTAVSYDKLLLATGARPVPPDIPGANLAGVTGFSSYADATRLIELCQSARTAVVVGRGLQGVELIRALRLRGLQVTLLVMDESPWFPALFRTGRDAIEGVLKEFGVRVITRDDPAELLGSSGRVTGVKTRGGLEIPAGIVGFAGVQRTKVEYVVGTGVSLAEGVVVDPHLRSTDARIFAAGDVAQLEVEGVRRPLGYGWLRARAHGEVAGRTMAGEEAAVATGDEMEAQTLYGQSLLARWR